MAHIEFAPGVADDLDRIVRHLEAHDALEIEASVAAIIAAFDVLEQNPRIGTPAGARELRELVIGRDTRGYVALYCFIPELDSVFVLAIRGQREAGFRRGE